MMKRNLYKSIIFSMILLLGNVAHGENVYMVGFYGDFGKTKACYWLNGIKNDLPPLNSISSEARSIFIDNNIIYIAGNYKGVDGVTRACYWKNGEKNDLPFNGTFSTARSIKLVNGVIYVVGICSNQQGKSIGCYWKDGVITFIPVEISFGAISMAVFNDNVYIAYLQYVEWNQKCIPYLWKDGVITELPLDNNMNISGFNIAIAVSNNTVCITTSYRRSNNNSERVCFWKNGIRNDLPESEATANAITILNNDIYIAGKYKSANGVIRACYWKNGKIIDLHERSTADSIKIYNNSVYIAGASLSVIACYWKDGLKIETPSDVGISTAIDIAVIE